jgi:flagellar motor switch protein FliN/FliY
MTDTKDHEEIAPNKEQSDAGVIIDATARRQPRVHEPEPDRRENPEDIDFLSDIPLKLNVVLANTTIPLGDILTLDKDSIVPLDKLSGDPIDIYVENQKLGRGEVIVVHEKLRIRILEITPPFAEQKKPEDQDGKEE